MEPKRTALLMTILLLGSFLLLPYGCKKEETKDDNPVIKRDAYFIDVSEETDWNYWVVGKDGDFFFVQEENSIPAEVYVKIDPDHEGYTIFLDEQGYPDRALIQNHIFLFGNFNGNFMDISVVLPDGNVEIFREIETEVNWDELISKGANSAEAWSDVIRWTGHVVSGVACGVGLASAIPTGGISLTLTYIGCGAAVVGIAMEFLPEDYEILGLSAATVGSFATTLGCIESAGVSCALGLSAEAISITSMAVETFETQDDEVRMAESLLLTGSGDVQVTLTWNNTSDIDLWVTDPAGERIWYAHPSSASGGVLDFDDTNGFGPENVYWPVGQAPSGTYLVQINYYSGEGTAGYTVLIQAENNVDQFQGLIGPDQTIDIASFTIAKDGIAITPILKTNTADQVKVAK